MLGTSSSTLNTNPSGTFTSMNNLSPVDGLSFPLYNTGIAAFFGIAMVFVVIFVNIGFAINDTDKAVVEDAYDEVREQLEVSGKISAVADVSSNKCPNCQYEVKQSSKFCRMCGSFPI